MASPKGRGVSVLGWCLNTAPRVTVSNGLRLLPDSCWQCRIHWESCEISPQQQRSKVKFSFPVFLFLACYNFEENFICRHDSVTFCRILIGALPLICADVSWLVSSVSNRLCFLAGILPVASLSNIPCIELQLSLLWVEFLQLSVKGYTFHF